MSKSSVTAFSAKTNATINYNKPALLKGFTFALFMTSAILISFFPAYLVSKGYTNIQIGFIYSIGPMLSILSNLIWGYISDKYNTLKKTIMFVLCGQLCFALLLFHVNSYVILFIVMTFFYFFQTPLNSLNDSQLLLNVSSSGRSYASFRIWGSVGFAVSALLFGLLLQSQNAYPQLIAILLAATILFSLLLSFGLKDSRGHFNKVQFSGLFKTLFSQKMLVFLILVLIVSIAHRSNDAFLSLYMLKLGASKTMIGFSWTISALSEIPVFFILSRYGHRYKELPLLAVASFAYVIRFFLMSIATQPYEILAIQSLHSITFGIYLITALRYMMQLVPDHFRATGQAVFNVVWSGLAGLISSLCGGIIFQHWGGHVLYRFSTLFAFIALVGFLIAHYKNERQLQ